MLRRNLLAALCAAATAGPAAAGSAVLTWDPPTQNTDGTPLTDLAGYRVRWGCGAPGDYPNERYLLVPGLRSVYLPDLPNSGTCYFTVHAVNSGRVAVGNGLFVRSSDESAPANPAQKVMNSAPPSRPYTRRVDFRAAPSAPPLEVSSVPVRIVRGFVGDPLEFRRDATSGPTRAELRAVFVQSGEEIAASFTQDPFYWAPPYAGLWEILTRSCAGETCGDWRSSIEDGVAFWFTLKPPTGGGIDP